MRKRILSTVMASCLIFCLVSVSNAASVWDGSVAAAFESGSGSEQDPYIIATASQLAYFSKQVNSGNSFAEKYISLSADISLGASSSEREWAPIGMFANENASPFSGTFNGNGHIVSKLYCSGANPIQGLFGYTDGAKISGVKMKSHYVFGAKYDGAVVGFAKASVIKDCSSDGKVEGVFAGGIVGYSSKSKISKCISYGSVVGKDDNTSEAGGIVAHQSAESDLRNCFNGATVSGYGYVGGIVGVSYGLISDSSNEGYISGYVYIGGIAGQNSEYLTRCYNLGNVFASSDVAGGISGFNKKSVYNCFNNGRVTGNSFVGGVSGYANEAVVTSYNTGIVSGGSLSGAIVGGEAPVAQNSYYLDSCGCGGAGISLNEEQMKQKNSYGGFDFENIWRLADGAYYPMPELIANQYTRQISGGISVFRSINLLYANEALNYSGVTLSYKWFADGKEISGATKNVYALTAEDVGKNISVTAEGTGRYTGVAASAPLKIDRLYASGDTDGSGVVEITDAIKAFMFVAGKASLSESEILRANVDCEGTVDVSDAIKIFKFVAGARF